MHIRKVTYMEDDGCGWAGEGDKGLERDVNKWTTIKADSEQMRIHKEMKEMIVDQRASWGRMGSYPIGPRLSRWTEQVMTTFQV